MNLIFLYVVKEMMIMIIDVVNGKLLAVLNSEIVKDTIALVII